MRRLPTAGGVCAAGLCLGLLWLPGMTRVSAQPTPTPEGRYASPLELLLSPDGMRLYVLCQGSDEVRVLNAGPAISVNPDHPAIDVAARAFKDVLGRDTVFVRSGGSIPIVGDFARQLHIPTILMGFGLPDDGLHSPNEKYKLSNYYAGIVTIAHFFEQYGS